MMKHLFLKGCLGIASFLTTSLVSEGVTLPKTLREVPFADTSGMVLDVTSVEIKGVEYPYNAALIKYKNIYRLFFRYDTGQERDIACVDLDSHFQPLSDDFIHIDTKSRFSEDPRVLHIDKQLFMVYNDKSGYLNRSIYVATLDSNTLLTKQVMRMPDFRLPGVKRHAIEKNWSPFISYDEDGFRALSFEYQINPRIILRLENPKVDRLAVYNPDDRQFLTYKDLWPSRWGKMCGGTPGEPISSNTCLAFFHSRFREENVDWYVMGAYTFENKAPFRIKSVSEAPILFQGIYEGETMRPDLRTCYPAGLVVEEREGRKLVHVSCGWNDVAIKIVTMDLDKLLKSLKKIR